MDDAEKIAKVREIMKAGFERGKQVLGIIAYGEVMSIVLDDIERVVFTPEELIELKASNTEVF